MFRALSEKNGGSHGVTGSICGEQWFIVVNLLRCCLCWGIGIATSKQDKTQSYENNIVNYFSVKITMITW
jgi:hypothetical protein